MLLWSTLAMFLFYIAYRYNLLFVSKTAVDTQGLIYPRALKQLFVGIYVAEICMIGLFAVSKAGGPAALMAVFLIFTVLYHITMTRSLNPLLYGLPRSLEMAEADMQARLGRGDSESGASKEVAGTNGVNGAEPEVNGEDKHVSDSHDYGQETKKKKEGNVFTRFLKPWLFADFVTLRHQVPRESDIDFAQLQADTGDISERNAYFPPGTTTEPPQLWIPRDPAGVSKQEIALTSKVIPISDNGASLDEKAGVKWSEDLDDVDSLPPIFQKKVYY